jgi:rhodanese-related sulfurtransferase
MPSRPISPMLLLALPFACATPAPRPPAAALAGDAVAASSGAAVSRATVAAPSRIDGATAKRLVAEGAKLVDVRDAESYAQGHIEGAVNVPVTEIAERATEIGPREASIVVYCRSGMRSAKAAAILAGLGYQRVYDLGSYLNWGEGAPAATPLPAAAGPKT